MSLLKCPFTLWSFFFEGGGAGGCTYSTWMFPGWGWNCSCSCLPTSQPQQPKIQATSAIYTTDHNNTGPLTH